MEAVATYLKEQTRGIQVTKSKWQKRERMEEWKSDQYRHA